MLHPAATAEDCAAFIDAQRDEIADLGVKLAHERDATARLRAELAAQKIETERAALWAAHLSLDLHSLKSKVTRFVKGVGLTPWKTTVPRVLGFKEEFDEMVTELAKPEATLPSAEEIKAATGP